MAGEVNSVPWSQDVQTTMKFIGVTVENLDSAMDVLAGDRSQYWKDRGVVSIAD